MNLKLLKRRKMQQKADQPTTKPEMSDEAVRKLIETDPNYQPLLWKSTEDTPESRARLTTNKDVSVCAV